MDRIKKTNRFNDPVQSRSELIMKLCLDSSKTSVLSDGDNNGPMFTETLMFTEEEIIQDSTNINAAAQITSFSNPDNSLQIDFEEITVNNCELRLGSSETVSIAKDVLLCNDDENRSESEYDNDDQDPDYHPTCSDVESDDENVVQDNTIFEETDSNTTTHTKGNLTFSTELSIDEEDGTISKKRTRWRRPQPENWKVNRDKKLKKEGLPYESKKKKIMAAKLPKPVDCSSCVYKCNENFDEETRIKICQEFTKSDYVRQKDILLSYVKRSEVERKRKRSGIGVDKNWSFSYYLRKGCEEVRVCKPFFLKTLSISNGPLKTSFSNKSDYSGNFSASDERGHKTPPNKTSEFFIDKIKLHIESFPAKESHYCRKNSTKKYLDPLLSISKLYELFKLKCEEEHLDNIPSINVYRNIFCSEYNLDFHHPKKDRCLICSRFESAKEDEKARLTAEYDQHIVRRNEANACKEEDKKKATEDRTFVSASFDLQRVLQIPCSNESPFYYSRKLNAYNLTVYEAAPPNNGFCYAWTEINGKRGSCEIGSAVLSWFKTLPQTVEHVTVFSDTCGGQNRNRYMAALFMFMAENFHFSVIEHKFMEKGHSHMEVDSMHSAIEYAQRNVPIYTMRDWLNVFLMARSNRKKKMASKYIIKEMTINEFFDLKKLSQSIVKNTSLDSVGNKVEWLRIKRLCFRKDSPGVIFFSYDHSTPYKELHVNPRGRGRPAHHVLEKLYSQPIPISEMKKKDLLKLCSSGAIPNECHQWYKEIPSLKSKKDDNRIPEPNVDEYFEEDEEEFE